MVYGPDGRPWHSWRVLILPYLLPEISNRYRFDEPWDGPNNRELAPLTPKMYKMHGRDVPGPVTNYLAVVGGQTIWPPTGDRRNTDVRDGLHQTILIVENLGADVHWMEPRDLAFDKMPMAVQRPDGISSWFTSPAVVMADCQVLRLEPTIQPQTLRALLTIDGGERVEYAQNGWTIIQDGRDREMK